VRVRGCPPAGASRSSTPRGRPGKAVHEPARQQGLRDRLGLRRHLSCAARSTTTILHGRRPRAHAHQSLGRRAGGNHQRRDDLTSASPSAHGDDHARAAAPSASPTRTRPSTGRRRPRPVRLPRAVPMVERMTTLGRWPTTACMQQAIAGG
jgi:hypothetical protein